MRDDGRIDLWLITPESPEIRRHRRGQFNNFIQLTMPYLAGFVDERRYKILLIDEYNQHIPYRQHADLVAITVNTPNANHCYAMADRLRAGSARVVMGGPHATLCPDEVAARCDYLIVGEAEESWPRFLDDFYRGCPKARYSCARTPELRGTPLPRRDLVQRRHFTKGAVIATRGCPYQCGYCNLKQIYDPAFRMRPVAEVIADIKSMPNRYFVFWDDNFFGDPEYTTALLKALKGLKRRWAAQVSIDHCRDSALLRLAREAGCVYLFIGLESFSAAGLATVNKGWNCVDDYRGIIENIHSAGIAIQAGIIFGFDTDTTAIFSETLQACESLGVDGVTVSMLTPLPGTALYHSLRAEGRLLSEDWANYNGKTRVAFQPKLMTAAELLAGYWWFRRRFYSLSSILRRMRVSRTQILHNLIVNLGYKLALDLFPVSPRVCEDRVESERSFSSHRSDEAKLCKGD